MLKDNQQARILAIVIVGSFNPAIIQPYWLANKKFIKEHEAKNAVVEFVHPQLTKFSLDWVNFEVSADKFIVRSQDEAMFQIVFDLFISIFTTLSQTPIRAIGINHIIHYIIPDKQKYVELGNLLAPFSNWTDLLEDPRLLNLEMIETKRKDGNKGHYSIKIQPSDLIQGQNAIMVSVNDHLTDDENVETVSIVKKVEEIWGSSSNRVDEVINHLSNKLNL